MWWKNSSMASSPPAEAPIPTIRKPGDGAGVAFTGCRLRILFLAPRVAVAILPGVFRAAATESSPRHHRDRGIENSSTAAERLIRSQSLCLFLISDKERIRCQYDFLPGLGFSLVFIHKRLLLGSEPSTRVYLVFTESGIRTIIYTNHMTPDGLSLIHISEP